VTLQALQSLSTVAGPRCKPVLPNGIIERRGAKNLIRNWTGPNRSPTAGLTLGLVITLAAVIAYSSYVAVQIGGLRKLQNDLIDRNRKDSIQLIRIQNDLNSVALGMRDMLDNEEHYPLTAWTAQFGRIRTDLDDAMHLEENLAGAGRATEQKQYVSRSLAQFWDAVDRVFALARNGQEEEARTQIRLSLQAREAALNTAVSRLLIQNNESEQEAAQRITQIYDGVQRQAYIFLVATLSAILLTSFYIIRSIRRLFRQVTELSENRSELAQKLISTQESTLRYVSRELHDEFGQILTAIGALLSRSRKYAPAESRFQDGLTEVAEITQEALENIRSLSQALHPVMIDETGLEAALDWYIPSVEKQTGLEISYEKPHRPISVRSAAATHIYRIVQEALNNVVRHSGTKKAWVGIHLGDNDLRVDIEDHGAGLPERSLGTGIGLVAMRERAELLGGRVEFLRPDEGGTLVRLIVPLEKSESDEAKNIGSIS
jgi:signal transduction histidine kinase